MTSMMHLSFTLGGQRTLRIGSWPDSNLDCSSDSSVWNDKAWQKAGGFLTDVKLRPGSVYLSSPSSYQHAPKFEKCSKEDPIIALQCRLAFLGTSRLLRKTNKSCASLDVACVVSDVLKTSGDQGKLRLPSLKELKQIEKELKLVKGFSQSMSGQDNDKKDDKDTKGGNDQNNDKGSSGSTGTTDTATNSNQNAKDKKGDPAATDDNDDKKKKGGSGGNNSKQKITRST